VKVESLGEIIAERHFTLVRGGNESGTVIILLGKPQNIPNHTDFYCPYQIKGFSSDKIRAACRIDAFQAMPLAMDTIGVELGVLQQNSGGRLVWDADDRGDLGFPVSDPEKE
jgi:hypothetical protein